MTDDSAQIANSPSLAEISSSDGFPRVTDNTRNSYSSIYRLHACMATEFASAQSDAYANPDEVGNPEGGWEDEDYMFEVSWEEEIWDDSGAY